MADYPPEALAAVAREVARQRHTGPPVDSDRQFAAGILDIAAPLLAEAWGAFECEPLRLEPDLQALCAHLDTDHAVMVALGRIAEAAVTMLEHVTMDTEEDREFHARAVGALRSQLDKMAATMKEANEAAAVPPEGEEP